MKKLSWAGTAYSDLCDFPREAKKLAGRELRRVQAGAEPIDWKPMKSIGSGVHEIRIHAEGEYRVIYVAKFHDQVYVLHAFEKKSQKTPRRDCYLAQSRYKAVVRALIKPLKD